MQWKDRRADTWSLGKTLILEEWMLIIRACWSSPSRCCLTQGGTFASQKEMWEEQALPWLFRRAKAEENGLSELGQVRFGARSDLHGRRA
jgi:hypothetical protein